MTTHTPKRCPDCIGPLTETRLCSLHAAAPELLAACKSSMAAHKSILSSYGEDTGEGMEAKDEIEKLYTAIAHAEGR